MARVPARHAGRQLPVDPTSVAAIVRKLDLTRDWVEREGRFESDRRRAQLLGVFDQARKDIQSATSGGRDLPPPPPSVGEGAGG